MATKIEVGDYVQVERPGVAVITKRWYDTQELLEVVNVYAGFSEAGQQRVEVKDREGKILALDATRWKKADLRLELESEEL